MVRKKAKQGDIVKINLNPTKGHEQAGYRPVLVVSNEYSSQASNMTIVCPITNTDRNNPVHVKLKNLKTTGFVMCDQVRAIDLHARTFTVTETVPDDTLWEVCDILHGLIEMEAALNP